MTGETLKTLIEHSKILKIFINWQKEGINLDAFELWKKANYGKNQTKKGTATSSFGTNGRINHNSDKSYNSKLYSEIERVENLSNVENPLPKQFQNTFILGNAENMHQLPDNYIHLMITSPPYNITKEYDKDLALSEYLQMLENVFRETYRVVGKWWTSLYECG